MKWGYVDQTFDMGRFIYPAGALGFSVAVFSVLALTNVAFFAVRRKVFGAELGGPDGPKKASTLICISFWFTYLALSILRTRGVI